MIVGTFIGKVKLELGSGVEARVGDLESVSLISVENFDPDVKATNSTSPEQRGDKNQGRPRASL